MVDICMEFAQFPTIIHHRIELKDNKAYLGDAKAAISFCYRVVDIFHPSKLLWFSRDRLQEYLRDTDRFSREEIRSVMDRFIPSGWDHSQSSDPFTRLLVRLDNSLENGTDTGHLRRFLESELNPNETDYQEKFQLSMLFIWQFLEVKWPRDAFKHSVEEMLMEHGYSYAYNESIFPTKYWRDFNMESLGREDRHHHPLISFIWSHRKNGTYLCRTHYHQASHPGIDEDGDEPSEIPSNACSR